MSDSPIIRLAYGCPFCDDHRLEPQIVAETRGFYLVADLHPLREGHLLIIPREHLPCYGALPEDQDAEFLRLKSEVSQFLAREYAPPVFLEHGVAGQSVKHAHLHAIPGASGILAAVAPGRESMEAKGPADVRAWYADRGPYLYCEEDGRAVVLTPGRIPSGFLHTTLIAWSQAGTTPRPDGETATRHVRERWQRYRVALGQGDVEVVTCFLWREGRICLFKRSDRVGSARGKWHGVSGYLPAGADPLDHALAELSQETGLRPPQIILLKAGAPLDIRDPLRGFCWRIHPFLFELVHGEPRLNWEHVDLAWIRPYEMSSYDCVPWLPSLYSSLDPSYG